MRVALTLVLMGCGFIALGLWVSNSMDTTSGWRAWGGLLLMFAGFVCFEALRPPKKEPEARIVIRDKRWFR